MQGGIKYHFFSLQYDSTWDWTPVSRAIGEHSTTRQVQKQLKVMETFTICYITQVNK